MAGKRFRADVGEDGIEVADDVCSRKVRWPGVKLNGENEHIFVFYAPDTIFMFGKKYLNDEQQEELRKLSGLKCVS